MIKTVPFPETLSEQWLLERTYYAQLQNGRELSVSALTLAITTLTRSRQICTTSTICQYHCKKEDYLRHLLARAALFQEKMQTEQNRISREYILTNNKPLEKQ